MEGLGERFPEGTDYPFDQVVSYIGDQLEAAGVGEDIGMKLLQAI